MKYKKEAALAALVVILAVGAGAAALLWPVNTANEKYRGFKVLRIAHAGGALDDKVYTNSYQAMERNLKKNFKYFELDFSHTSDGKLVCVHDWEDKFKMVFGFELKEAPTLERFKTYASAIKDFTPCTLDGLAEWMKKNPAAVIVTDVKEDNMNALPVFFKTIPDAHRRVIPQIYNPRYFEAAKKMGFEQIIWTLYRYNGSDDDILAWVSKFTGKFAITMHVDKARSNPNLIKALAAKNVATYVHPVNDPAELAEMRDKYGVAEIYSFYLNP